MGLFSKKNTKEEVPVPEPNDSPFSQGNDMKKLDDIPQSEDKLSENSTPKESFDAKAMFENGQKSKMELPPMPGLEQNFPKMEDLKKPELEKETKKEEDNDLSLPDFDKEDASRLPEKIPFDDILSENSESDENNEELEESLNIPDKEEDTIKQDRIEKEIFVKVSKYRNILKEFEDVKKKLNNSKKTITSISQKIDSENKDLEEFKVNLNDIQQNLLMLDTQIFEN